MPTFSEQLANDFDHMMNPDEFATTAVYRSKDDLLTEYEVEVLFGESLAEAIGDLDGVIVTEQPFCYFRALALAVACQAGDEIDIDDTTYYVQSVREDATGGVRLILSEDQSG